MRRILGFGLSVVIAGAVLAPAAGAQPGKGAPGKPAGSAKAAASAAPAAAPASAAPATPPTAAGPASNVDQARAHFQTGSDLEKAGNVKGAYGEYKVAFGLYPHWQITGNLARTAAKLGKHVEAAEMYRRVRDDAEAQKALPAEARADLEKSLADSQSKVVPLTVDAPAGTEVWIDGVLIGAAPLSKAVPVDPGSHEVDVRQGVTSLKKMRVWTAPGKPATADLSKVVVPGGSAAPQASAAPVSTSAPEPDKGGGRSFLWPGIAFGAAGAGAIMAAVGGGLAVVGKDKLAQDCGPTGSCPEGSQSQIDEARVASHISTAGFVLLGVGAAVGVTLLLLPDRSNETPRTSLIVSPSFVGVRRAF